MSEEDKSVVSIEKIPTQDAAISKFADIGDDYRNYLESLPPAKRSRIIGSVQQLRHGQYSIAPITCTGPEKCLFFDKCPIPDRDKSGVAIDLDLKDFPLGKPCILEKFFIQQKMIEYMQHLDVDPGNPVEMSIINELALQDLYKNRAVMILSSGDRGGDGRDFMKMDTLGYGENGEAAEVSKIHPVFEILEKIEKRKEHWLEKLMETRKAKADWMARFGDGSKESQVLEEIRKLKEAIISGTEKRVPIGSDTPQILLDE